MLYYTMDRKAEIYPPYRDGWMIPKLVLLPERAPLSFTVLSFGFAAKLVTKLNRITEKYGNVHKRHNHK